jgi:hypothetical protein
MRELFSIWCESSPTFPELPWRAQMADYMAHFKTREAAEKYVENIRQYRARMAIAEQQKRV